MLETIRQFGREILCADGEELDVQQRHLAWYLKLAEDTHHRWFGATQEQIADRMLLEQTNIRAAMEFCLATSGQSHEDLRIADACRDVWRVNGLVSEGRRWFERLLGHHDQPSVARARALASATLLASRP
ncbi:hypothetical protein [Saccharopolyspora hattusasensis]|uniref:hypothetical protein n=1 Tax=Saccharopolyspora hattusasensis TaxID=1128679 RepID=UPI003D995A2C